MAEVRRRIYQRQESSVVLPSSIAAPSVDASTSVSFVSAAPTEFATTLLSFSDGIRTATVVATAEPSATRQTDNAHGTASSSTSASTASSTSAAAASKDSLIPLLPAIIAPIAAVLILSFLAFWIFMRRRSKKAVQNEPEFVMEGMKEKPRSRPITADSNSSTQELVPNKNKETAVHVTEVDRNVKDTNFTLPKIGSSMDSRPGSRQDDPSGRSKAVPNFSRGPGARPNTAGRDAAPSPAPQDRGNSRAGQRPPPSSATNGHRSNKNSQDTARNDLPRPGIRPAQPRTGSFSRPLVPPSNTNRGPPAAIHTKSDRPSQERNHYQPPPGAYNGSSPISQYSPIVKDIPKFGTSPMATKPRTGGGSISSINDQGIRKAPPSAINTSNSPLTPADPNFSDENMRIARLASNSRFHSVVATTAATSPATEEPPTPSPRLPPPATRDAPPTNYNIPLPTQEPPAPASIQARLNGVSISDRRSVISGLSDDYVDMEVDDNKSDVSSLDEREKWQMQSDNDRANSRQGGLGGYGGLGPRPAFLDSGLDSEASSSQYSLGYYTKDSTGRDTR